MPIIGFIILNPIKSEAAIRSINGYTETGQSSEDDKSCWSKGYRKICPDNTAGTDSCTQNNKTYYKSCCDRSGYVNSCPTGQKKIDGNKLSCDNSYFKCECEKISIENYEDCKISPNKDSKGKSCYIDCKDKSCKEGGYKDSCGENEKGTLFKYGDNNCYSNCIQKQCSDSPEGLVASCDNNQTGNPVSYAGKTCYKNCQDNPKPKDCADAGYKDNVPSGETCTQIYYEGNFCYKDCKNICPATVSCSWGCKNTCGGNCVECLPACEKGYRYNFKMSDCIWYPAIMVTQNNNSNCGKCECDNTKYYPNGTKEACVMI